MRRVPLRATRPNHPDYAKADQAKKRSIPGYLAPATGTRRNSLLSSPRLPSRKSKSRETGIHPTLWSSCHLPRCAPGRCYCWPRPRGFGCQPLPDPDGLAVRAWTVCFGLRSSYPHRPRSGPTYRSPVGRLVAGRSACPGSHLAHLARQKPRKMCGRERNR